MKSDKPIFANKCLMTLLWNVIKTNFIFTFYTVTVIVKILVHFVYNLRMGFSSELKIALYSILISKLVTLYNIR